MLKCAVLILALMPAAAFAAPWRLSPETKVTVEVPWHGKQVPVSFPTLTGTVDFDETHPERTKASISVATTTATTGVGVVDQLLRSRDYLDAAEYPAITFRLDKLTRTSKSTAEIVGRITLRGVTKPLALDAQVLEYGPAADDPSRFDAGFQLTGSLDRTEFGSTGGLPDVEAVLPISIRLQMSSK